MRRTLKSFYRLNLGTTKCYLLKCPEGYLLIDTAYANAYDRFRRAIDALGVDLNQIRYLLLTHHHDDHAGFAARLVEETGCATIFHRKALAPLSRGTSAETMKPVNRCIRIVFSLFRMIHREFNYPRLTGTDGSILLSGDDPDTLNHIGIEGEILYTPGHSADSISVVLSDGNAFVGDAAMNFLNFCRIKHRPIFIEDIDSVFASWKKLLRHGAKWIYPAHGRPFSADRLTGYRAGDNSNNS
jgi:glyoxylase-like metal-dependent hydrolase (beta-lactamase superfamily II)